MKKDIQNNVVVSVILPIRSIKDEEKQIKLCLDSFRDQTFGRFETIIVSKEGDGLSSLQRHYPNVRTLHCPYGKSAARNKGAKESLGEYIFHIDSNMILEPNVLKECIELSSNTEAKAVIIPELRDMNHSNFWARCRALEKELYVGDSTIEASRFLNKDTFNTIGGFDEDLDPIDEGDLQAKLDEKRVERRRTTSSIILSDSIHILESAKLKYQRGQVASLFKLKHLHSPQLVVFKRLKRYFKNWKKLVQNPILSAGLVILKTLEVSAFWLGNRFSPRSKKELCKKIRTQRIFEQESETYQLKYYQNTLGAKYIDQEEKKIIIDNLESNPELKTKETKILDLGMGGGRWSKVLLEKFEKAQVVGVDISSAMVKQVTADLKAFSPRFHAQVADMEHLPFKDNSFDAAINIRALKYVPNSQKALKEIGRVLKPDGILVLEVPKANIVSYPLFLISRLIRKLSKSPFIDYFTRISLFTTSRIKQLLKKTNFEIDQTLSAFALPSTIVIKINKQWTLAMSKFLDQALPKAMFGRSIFVVSRVTKLSHNHSNRETKQEAESRLQDTWDRVWQHEKTILTKKHDSKGLSALTHIESKAKQILSPSSMHRWIKRILLREIGDVKGKKILEVGSGSGRVSLQLAKMGAYITLLDISCDAIELSKKLFASAGVQAEFVCASAFEIPFKNGTFDAIWSVGVIEHFNYKLQLKMLKEMHRVLRNTGKVVTLCPNGEAYIYKHALRHAQRKGTYDYGYEKPVRTLRNHYQHLPNIHFAEEKSYGWLLQLYFLKYYFRPSKLLELAFMGLVEPLNRIFWFLNFLPGLLLVTVSFKKPRGELTGKAKAGRNE